MTTCFFFRIRPPGELDNKRSSARRGEFDSSTPGAIGVLLGQVFLAWRFRVVHNRNLSRQKNGSRKPPSAPRVRRPTSSRRGLLSGSCTSSIRGISEKKHLQVIITPWKIMNIRWSIHMQLYPRIVANVLVISVKILANLLVKPTELGLWGPSGPGSGECTRERLVRMAVSQDLLENHSLTQPWD